MRVSLSVMAHPEREVAVTELLDSLGGAAGEIPVSWDSEGPASGNADRVWRNARAAWGMHDPDADWHVLLQDDAIVCRDFVLGMREALRYAPEKIAVVSPYLGAGRTVSNRWDRIAARADEIGARWVRTNKVMWGVCLAVPTRAIGDMIAYADRRQGVPDDMRVAGWASTGGLEVWYPWPSMVDHRQVPSLTKHKAHDRRARRMLAGSALEIDWSGSVVTDPSLARTLNERSGPSARRRSTVGKPTARTSGKDSAQVEAITG